MAKAGNHGQIIPRDKKLLNKLYWQDNMSLPEMGQLFGVTHKSVERVMRELGIKRRPRGKSRWKVCKVCRERPVHKVQHAGNGSFYGTKCIECRRHHYAKIAKEYTSSGVPREKRDYRNRRAYYYGPLDPRGELQWLSKSKVLLRNARRLLLRPHSQGVWLSQNMESKLAQISQT